VRFSYAESMTDPAFYVPLAKAVEEAGYDSMVVPDSICYPQHSDTRYPFNPDGTREFLEDKPFLDPFVLAAVMGTVTERLRFVTFVLKLPIRHPVLVAKQAASVAVLTGDRFSLGVGTSPWPEDYVTLEVPWEGRGRRMDESLEVIRGLTDPDGGFFEYHGKVYDIPAIKMTPRPGAPLPILVGGHGPAALRRAAQSADGWLHGGGDPALLPDLLGELGRRLDEAGRPRQGYQIHVISMDAYSRDGVRRLEEQGVTDVIVGFRWPYVAGPDNEGLSTKLDNLRRFADQVIHKG
jgi:probable F420-dependent oxidoreductase